MFRPDVGRSQEAAAVLDAATRFVRERDANPDEMKHRYDIDRPGLLVRGERTSAMMDQGDAEMNWPDVQTQAVRLSGRTSDGGPQSKYAGRNEDSIFVKVDGKHTRVGVIDGAGGSEIGGRVASILTNTIFLEGGRAARAAGGESGLPADAVRADKTVTRYSSGTFAVGVFLEILASGEAHLLAVGDSKALTIRDGRKLGDGTTKLQNLTQEKIDRGIISPWEYYTDDQNNIITNAFGRANKKIPPTHSVFQTRTGDQIVLASDGVWDVVTEYELIQLARRYRGDALKKRIYELALFRNGTDRPFEIQFDERRRVQMAPRGGGDNISVVVVEKTEPVADSFATDDYVSIELPDGSVDRNWRIVAAEAEGWIRVTKVIGGRTVSARTPEESLRALNPHGSAKNVTFDGTRSIEEVLSILDTVRSVRGSQQEYASAELKRKIEEIVRLGRQGEIIRMREQLDRLTNGQAGQNLHDNVDRLTRAI